MMGKKKRGFKTLSTYIGGGGGVGNIVNICWGPKVSRLKCAQPANWLPTPPSQSANSTFENTFCRCLDFGAPVTRVAPKGS